MKTILKKSMAMVLVVLMALSCCAISSFAAVSDSDFSVEKIGDFVADSSSSSAAHTRDIAVYNNYLYVATRNEALKVYNITNPEAPELVYTMGSTLYGEGATDSSYTIDIHEGTLFMSFIDSENANNAIVRSFDLTNPAQPSYKATFESFWKNTNAIEVLSDGTLYCSCGSGWQSYANAHEATGTVTKTASITSGSWKVYESESGKGAFRFRLGTIASYVGGSSQINLASKAFATTGDYIYVLRDNALDVVDVSTGGFTTNYSSSKTTIDLTSLNFDETAVGEKGVVSNNHLYFFSASGILEFDVTNPASPVNVSTTLAGAGAQNVATYGDYFYTVNSGAVNIYKTASNSISMKRQASILAPTAAADYPIIKNARNVVSAGDYLFFGTGNDANGLCSYNVKTGDRVTGITARLEPNGAHNILVDGNYIYAAENTGLIKRVDISDPANPVVDMTIAQARNVNEETGEVTYSGAYGTFRGMVKVGNYFAVYGNFGARGGYIPEDEDYLVLSTSTGYTNLSNYEWVTHSSPEHGYIIDPGNNLTLFGKEFVTMDTGAYSVFADGGYLYIIKDGVLKVVNESAIYSDGAFSAELYAENTTSVAFTGIDVTKIRTLPVKYGNYLIYAADKLLVFDITNPAVPVATNIGNSVNNFAGPNYGMAINNGVLYVTNGTTTVKTVNLAYVIQEVASTEITSLPVTFAGTASGVDNITLTVGSDEYTVPVVNGAWEKTITEVSDANGEIEVIATAGISSVSADYTLNLPVEEPAELAVNVSYTDTFNATVTIENNSENKAFMVILVVYNGNEIYDVDYEVISATDTLSCVAPEGDVSGYTAKTFVWSNLMVPFLANPAVR